jgi:ribosomal protein S18 acetylase RimI-like enzyme
MAEATAQAGRLRELRLCVADDNFIGQRLYRSSGFERVAGDFGAYPGGQRAVRMVFPLPASAATDRVIRSAGGPSR